MRGLDSGADINQHDISRRRQEQEHNPLCLPSDANVSTVLSLLQSYAPLLPPSTLSLYLAQTGRHSSDPKVLAAVGSYMDEKIVNICTCAEEDRKSRVKRERNAQQKQKNRKRQREDDSDSGDDESRPQRRGGVEEGLILSDFARALREICGVDLRGADDGRGGVIIE